MAKAAEKSRSRKVSSENSRALGFCSKSQRLNHESLGFVCARARSLSQVNIAKSSSSFSTSLSRSTTERVCLHYETYHSRFFHGDELFFFFLFLRAAPFHVRLSFTIIRLRATRLRQQNSIFYCESS